MILMTGFTFNLNINSFAKEQTLFKLHLKIKLSFCWTVFITNLKTHRNKSIYIN